ncbi:MAG: SDR family NAD(P)-dependent oxidoreductase [Acidimicrobiia bacterium]|nr:SDR family NAD(P)-dependent oxidoreductase [Acidimicrobiia bacterium]
MHTTLIPTKVLAPAGGASVQLDGTVALVVGGGRGLARTVARRLAAAGARVGLLGDRSHEAIETVRLIRAAGGVAELAVADLDNRWTVAPATARLRERLGAADILVTPTDLLHVARFVLPDQLQRGHGRIVAITGQTGARRCRSKLGAAPTGGAPCAALAEIAAWHERDGIRTFSVDPGLPPVGMSVPDLRHGHGADHDRAAELILHLAAGDIDELSGRHLSVDGCPSHT